MITPSRLTRLAQALCQRPLGTAALLLLSVPAACGDLPNEASLDHRGQSAKTSGQTTSPGETDTTSRRSAQWFVEVSRESGLIFLHDAGLTAEKRLAETMGAGAVLADLNGDGHLDAYLVQSGPLPIFPRDGSLTNRLFLNDGLGTFRDATPRSGAAADSGYGMGSTAADVDLDGDLDLLLTNFGPDLLLLNDGSGVFTDDTARAGLGDDRWTGGAIFFDADGDGDPDLYVAAYVDEDLANPRWCGRREDGWRSACHPDTFEGLADRFWRNLGDGRFELATDEAGLTTTAGHHGKGLGVIALDVDGDLDLDLYIANDSVENRLWLNRGDGHFEDGTLLSGTGVNDRGLTEAGMGLASADVDDDGDPDLFVTNFDDESNTLYRNEGDGLFVDVTALAGLDAASRLPVGFGTFLGDLDGDGLLDLAVTNGHIIDNIHLYHDGKSHEQRALVFAGRGAGQFENVSGLAGELSSSTRVGRGLYGGDLDGDGDLDLLATSCGGRAQLYRNLGGPEGRAKGPGLVLWGVAPGTQLVLSLTSGRELHRSAVGQPSYFGLSSPRIHIGLGNDSLASVELLEVNGRRHQISFDPPARGGTWQLRSSAAGLQFVSSSPAPSEPSPTAPSSPGDIQR